jgi:hypothetical protein
LRLPSSQVSVAVWSPLTVSFHSWNAAPARAGRDRDDDDTVPLRRLGAAAYDQRYAHARLHPRRPTVAVQAVPQSGGQQQWGGQFWGAQQWGGAQWGQR